MIPQVTCYCDTDLVHAAYVTTGLIELADAGEIELTFRLCDPRLKSLRSQWTIWMRVRDDAQEYAICIDCHDLPQYFCPIGLAECRYYFKSNLGASTYSAVPQEHFSKLKPLGPNFPSRPRRDRSLTLRRAGSFYAKVLAREFGPRPRPFFRSAVKHLGLELFRRHKRYLSRKTSREYEEPPPLKTNTKASDSAIVYNPACWDEREGRDIAELNEERSSLILALRREFGSRFVGGFRRSETALAKYPEAVESHVLSHDEYIALIRSCPLAVYTNGKWGCFSWRLPELFAASKCIVSLPIPFDAGVPLDESCGVHQCEDVPGVVDQIRRLEADPKTVYQSRLLSWEYYENHLRPIERMRRVILESLPSPMRTQSFKQA